MANQELMYIHIPHESGMNVQNVVACKSCCVWQFWCMTYIYIQWTKCQRYGIIIYIGIYYIYGRFAANFIKILQ